MSEDDSSPEAEPADPETAALAQAARARQERRREADKNEIFNDVYKSAEEIRAEWKDQSRKLRLWAIVFGLAALGGFVVPVLWALGLIPAVGAAMTWESARERRRAYERLLFENELEQKILVHQSAEPAAALGANEGPREIG